ncbi:MAG: putative PEP-binding protein, partial [Planctomycetota bacterium]
MSDEQSTPTPEPQAATPRPPCMLRGTPVAPGLALGHARREGYDLDSVPVHRVPRDQVAGELNRFHRALTGAREELTGLQSRLSGEVPAEHVSILETHVTYLRDAVFLSDVENLVLGEQLSLEAAIAKVILDFDRIFRLVESDVLRERAVDLRDVGIRVLRQLERSAGRDKSQPPVPAQDYVLIARELSIVDMFNLDEGHVLAILTEGGSLTSHAAILARSMRIPTLTAVEGLLDEVQEGDFLIVDAAEGNVRVRPEDVLRQQYQAALPRGATEPTGQILPAPRTQDGVSITLAAACGNLPEVVSARESGVTEIGLYRTELMYLAERETPSVDALTAHYRSVLEQAGDSAVTFRLLDTDSSSGVTALHATREPNPQLGQVGVRALIRHESILRGQLAAILRAGAGRDA